ncbi:hypothetical protein BC829DRAFT_75909 [Chytridium lagenaria]|nr:hypothetical protein BC829DRAFT_75909 [Chytridium lagenaria]
MDDDRSDCTVLSSAFPSLSIPTQGCCSGTVIMGIVCRTTSEPSTDPSFPSITRIRSIDFTGRSLSGPVPSVLADLRWLTSLRLNANAWTGNLPESFRTMTSLTDMSFFDSSLSGPLPSWLGELTEMQTLNMDHTQISGPIPDSIRRWSKLRKLWLGHNNLFGDISTIFTSSNHPNLELLDIAGNFISGRLDVSLEQTSQM